MDVPEGQGRYGTIPPAFAGEDQTHRGPTTPRASPWRMASLVSVLVVMAVVGAAAFAAAPVPSAGLRTSADLAAQQAEGQAGFAAATASPTHVLFVLVDDMGFNDVGYQSIDLAGVTPTIDDLANEGIKLSRYYSMHMCTPARSALLTAKYPAHVGMQFETIKPNSEWGLPTSEVTLANMFKSNGFATHGFGKWNQGHASSTQLPTSRGFNTFYGYLTDEIHYHNHTYPEVFCGSLDLDTQDTSDMLCDYVSDFMAMETNGAFRTISNRTFSNRLFNDKMKHVIHDHVSKSSDPLFVYWAAQNVHGPLDLVPDSWVSDEQMNVLGGLPNPHRQLFGRLAAALDKQMKDLIATFTDEGLWDDTLMVFTSDNGGCQIQGGSNNPLRGGKHFLFDGGVRVPAFIWSKPIAESSLAGTTFGELFHVTDWMPTLVSAANLDMSAAGVNASEWDGVDQWKSLTSGGVGQAARQEVLINMNSYTVCCEDVHGGTTCSGDLGSCSDVFLASVAPLLKPRAALISGDYKLILNEYGMPWFNITEATVSWKGAGGPSGKYIDSGDMGNCMTTYGVGLDSFLFNLANDPEETTNLIDVETEVANQLTLRLTELLRTEVYTVWTPPTETPYEVWNQADKFIVPWLDQGAASTN